MEYDDYSVEDFLEDASFRRWVLDPTTDPKEFWNRFPEEYPDKAVEFGAALEFVKTLVEGVENRFPDPETERAVLAEIRRGMRSDKLHLTKTSTRWWRIAAAASITVLLALGYFYKQTLPSGNISYEQLRRQSETQLVERINHTDKPLLVSLSDGSLVFLKPDSRISYAGSFADKNLREVFLSGEAYFEVTKNPKKPFVVFAGELVTKVLGTSFTIRAFDIDDDVVVKVNTGKVSVALTDEISTKNGLNKRERQGILLLPNQQAVLSRKNTRLVKAPVDNPVALPGESNSTPVHSFKFENAHASEVFAAIEKAYGVNLIFDAELFSNCLFKGDLTEESLFQKLDVLCLSIEAKYQIKGSQIIVSGNGCGSQPSFSP